MAIGKFEFLDFRIVVWFKYKSSVRNNTMISDSEGGT